MKIKDFNSEYIAKIKEDGTILNVESIHFALGVVNLSDDSYRLIDEVELLEYTGILSKDNVRIYEGQTVQPLRVSEYKGTYICENIGKPFVVKKGNYVYGKWIADNVSEEGFGINCYGNQLEIVGGKHGF